MPLTGQKYWLSDVVSDAVAKAIETDKTLMANTVNFKYQYCV